MLSNTLLQKSSQFLLDLLYPPGCVSCEAAAEWLCQDCLSNISFITPPVCQRCGISINGLPCCVCKDNALQFIDGIRSASYFEDNPIRPAIHFLKYRNHKAVASILGRILVDTYRDHNLDVDVIIPVPLHASRLKERGYNQSELLAREIAVTCNLSVNTTTLQRVKKTKPQVKLGVDERRQNVKKAFDCTSQKLAGQKVLLVDDVCTTGSTLDASAAALKEGGAVSVWGLTLARAR